MNNSKLIKNQSKEYTRRWECGGVKYAIVAKVRHDDRCGNGHNSFAITADVYSSETRSRRDGYFRGVGGWIMGGCCHEVVAKHVPELAPLIKWHLCDTENGPMHYMANALYHAGHCKRWARSEGESENYTADWKDFASHVVLGAVASDPATTETLEKMSPDELKAWLVARQPALMDAFRRDVEALGLVF